MNRPSGKSLISLGAGFNLLLLFMLGSTFFPDLVSGWITRVRSQPGPLISPELIVILFVILGIWLWVALLRTYSKAISSEDGLEPAIAVAAVALGLGAAGFSAWLRWFVSGGTGLDSVLVSVTLLGAIILLVAAWLVGRRLGLSSIPKDGQPNAVRGTVRDYILLTKPIVLALLLVTTLAAMIVAAGGMPQADLVLWTMIGGAFSGGGASALNQYIDRVRDGKMARTKRRPLPEGRLQPHNVILFGTLLCIAGFYTLAIFVNLLSAFLAFAGMVYYVVLYSLMLKPSTTQNIVIGGGAGAIPPLVGWAAAAGELSMPAFFLFALVFFWTPPHFWALALLKRRDYARAGVPMLPVVYGPQETRWQIMLYTLQVVALTLLLPLARLGGYLYFLSALALGGGLVFYAWRLWRLGGNQPAYKMYRYSSTYLALIFAALVVDTLI